MREHSIGQRDYTFSEVSANIRRLLHLPLPSALAVLSYFNEWVDDQEIKITSKEDPFTLDNPEVQHMFGYLVEKHPQQIKNMLERAKWTSAELKKAIAGTALERPGAPLGGKEINILRNWIDSVAPDKPDDKGKRWLYQQVDTQRFTQAEQQKNAYTKQRPHIEGAAEIVRLLTIKVNEIAQRYNLVQENENFIDPVIMQIQALIHEVGRFITNHRVAHDGLLEIILRNAGLREDLIPLHESTKGHPRIENTDDPEMTLKQLMSLIQFIGDVLGKAHDEDVPFGKDGKQEPQMRRMDQAIAYMIISMSGYKFKAEEINVANWTAYVDEYAQNKLSYYWEGKMFEELQDWFANEGVDLQKVLDEAEIVWRNYMYRYAYPRLVDTFEPQLAQPAN